MQDVLGKVPREQLHTFLEPQDECGWTPLMVAAAKGNSAAANEVEDSLFCLWQHLLWQFAGTKLCCSHPV